MAQTCRVCAHHDRAEIDMLIATNRMSDRAVGDQYGLSVHSILRHRRAHLPKLLRELGERVGVIASDQIMAQMVQLYEASLKNLARAEGLVLDDEPRTVTATAAAIREARRTIESMAALSIRMRASEMQAPEQPQHVANIGAEITAALAQRTAAIEQAKSDIVGTMEGTIAEDIQVEDAEIVDALPLKHESPRPPYEAPPTEEPINRAQSHPLADRY